MSFFSRSTEGSHQAQLHNIYLSKQRDPNKNILHEISKLSDGDYELDDRLREEYSERYGDHSVAPGGVRTGYVYFLKAEGFYGFASGVYGRYKIGLSNNPQRRLIELNGQQAPCKITNLRAIQVEDMHAVEGELHKKFKANRKHGEWFDFWFWEIPLVHFEYNRYQNSFRRNKMARGRNFNPALTGAALFLGLATATALFVSSISPDNASPATEPSITQPVKAVSKTKKTHTTPKGQKAQYHE